MVTHIMLNFAMFDFFLIKHIGGLAIENLTSTNKSIIIEKNIISLLKKVLHSIKDWVSHKNVLILDSNLYFYLLFWFVLEFNIILDYIEIVFKFI